jgi:hypothetical protein
VYKIVSNGVHESHVVRLMTFLSKSISSTKCLSKHFVDKFLSTSISSTAHFVYSALRRQIFVYITLRRRYTSSTLHFVDETFLWEIIIFSFFPPSEQKSSNAFHSLFRLFDNNEKLSGCRCILIINNKKCIQLRIIFCFKSTSGLSLLSFLFQVQFERIRK